MMGSHQPSTSGMNWKWTFRSLVHCLVLESGNCLLLSFEKSVRAWLYCYRELKGAWESSAVEVCRPARKDRATTR